MCRICVGVLQKKVIYYIGYIDIYIDAIHIQDIYMGIHTYI